ncbi:hypothetical protein [Streptomyces sp. NPDC002845]
MDSGARATAEALKSIVHIMVAYEGAIQDITVGDFVAMQAIASGTDETRGVRLAYHWLREQEQFPSDAPETLISFARRSGQVTPAMLVDRYQLQCQPVRDLLVDYITERQATLDYSSLRHLSAVLAGLFWADLEKHHPGINSLSLRQLENAGQWAGVTGSRGAHAGRWRLSAE